MIVLKLYLINDLNFLFLFFYTPIIAMCDNLISYWMIELNRFFRRKQNHNFHKLHVSYHLMWGYFDLYQSWYLKVWSLAHYLWINGKSNKWHVMRFDLSRRNFFSSHIPFISLVVSFIVSIFILRFV